MGEKKWAKVGNMLVIEVPQVAYMFLLARCDFDSWNLI